MLYFVMLIIILIIQNTVRELESELNKLEKEKADLSVALATVKSEPSA